MKTIALILSLAFAFPTYAAPKEKEVLAMKCGCDKDGKIKPCKGQHIKCLPKEHKKK